MKLVYKINLFFLFAFLFYGCIETKTTINLNKDGSGTIEEKVLMTSDFVKMMSEFNLKSEDDTSKSEKFTLFNEKELKDRSKDFGEDVKYISGKEIKENGKEGYTVVYSFKNINQVKVNNDPGSQTSFTQSNTEAKEPPEFITFNYTGGNPSEVKVNMPSKKFDDSTESTVTSDSSNGNNPLEQEFYNMMKDFRFTLLVHINGKIENTNATYVDGPDITLLDVSFDKLLENKDKLNEMNKIKEKNIEAMKKLLKDVPGIKLELNDIVNVKYD